MKVKIIKQDKTTIGSPNEYRCLVEVKTDSSISVPYRSFNGQVRTAEFKIKTHYFHISLYKRAKLWQVDGIFPLYKLRKNEYRLLVLPHVDECGTCMGSVKIKPQKTVKEAVEKIIQQFWCTVFDPYEIYQVSHDYGDYEDGYCCEDCNGMSASEWRKKYLENENEPKDSASGVFLQSMKASTSVKKFDEFLKKKSDAYVEYTEEAAAMGNPYGEPDYY